MSRTSTSARPKTPHRMLGRLSLATAIALASTLLTGAPANAAPDLLESIPSINAATTIAFAPDGLTAFVGDATGGAATVYLIDTATNSQFDTLSVAAAPAAMAVSPDGLELYVGFLSTTSIQVFDLATLTLKTTLTTPGSITGLAFSADGTRLYASNYQSSSVSSFNATTETFITSVVVGQYPQGMALTPDGATLVVSLSGGGERVGFVKVSDMTLISTLTFTATRAFDVLIDKAGAFAYIADNDGGAVHVVDLATRSFVKTMPADSTLSGIAFNQDESKITVVLANSGVQELSLPSGTASAVTDLAGTELAGIEQSPTKAFAYIANSNAGSVDVWGEPVRRLTGIDRYGTAIEISKAGFPSGAPIVFVATGEDFPDALASGPVAAAFGGPVLLTRGTALPPEVKAEIQRLKPTDIVVVGGTNRVSAAVEAELATIAPTDRVTGSNRMETSQILALAAFGGPGANTVYIATGYNFPDALAAGAAGAVFFRPVLLVNGTAPTLDQGTIDVINQVGPLKIVIVGGSNMVSAGIEQELRDRYGSGAVERQTGTNRYETAYEINIAFPIDTKKAILATGAIFPDALAASAWAARIGAPLYLAPGTCVPQYVLDDMAAIGVTQVTLVGGPDRLTKNVFDLKPCPS